VWLKWEHQSIHCPVQEMHARGIAVAGIHQRGITAALEMDYRNNKSTYQGQVEPPPPPPPPVSCARRLRRFTTESSPQSPTACVHRGGIPAFAAGKKQAPGSGLLAPRKLSPPRFPALPTAGLVRPQGRAPRRPPDARGRQEADARVATVGAEEAGADAAPLPPTAWRKKWRGRLGSESNLSLFFSHGSAVCV
jgi:hypothetical protein